MMSGQISFRKGGVVYDKREYVAITNIIKAVGQSPKLADWKVRKAMDKAQAAALALSNGEIDTVEFLKRTGIPGQVEAYEQPRAKAAKEGEAAHSLLESFCLGDKAALAYWKEKLPVQFGAIDACLASEKIELTHAERFVFSDQGYCARFDAAGKSPKGSCVFSFKKTPALYADHFLQVAAEFYADFMVTDDRCDWHPTSAAFLHFQEGRCDIVPVTCEAHQDGLDGLLTMFRWKKRMGLF